MNSNRENLLKRLVDRKMAAGSRGERGCFPCFMGWIMCNTCVGTDAGAKHALRVPVSQSNKG